VKLVDYLGDQFRPAMHKGWQAYIKKTYAVDLIIMMVQLDMVIWLCLMMRDCCEVLGLLAWFSH
jgi:hypothetical protein